jgi:hypothetical protein
MACGNVTARSSVMAGDSLVQPAIDGLAGMIAVMVL